MTDSRKPLNPLLELTRVRLLEFVREPSALFWVFGFPVLLAVALGIAFRSKAPERLPVAVVGPSAAATATRLELSRDLAPKVMGTDAAEAALRNGRVDLVVITGDAGEAPGLRFDPIRGDSRAARLAVVEALAGEPPRVREEPVSEPGSRYIDFLIPGLIGLNLMGSGMWGIGFAIVQARVRKLLKRFAVTPMRRTDYLLSFALSRLVFLFLEVAALVAFGWLAFGVAVRGSIVTLIVVAVVGAGSFAGLGLLVAARCQTVESVSGWMNFVMLPMWVLSGAFFSYERFPAVIQPAIRVLPLTAANDALREVINQGAPLLETVPELAVLSAWGVVSFAVAVRIFRWQ